MRLGQLIGAQRRTKEATMTEDHKRKLQLLVDTGKLKWHMKIASYEIMEASMAHMTCRRSCG